MKKIFTFSLVMLSLIMTSCDPAALNAILNDATSGPTKTEIAKGLKDALIIGIGNGSETLSQKGGYLNSPYRILLPAEVRKVTEKLSIIPGFTQVEDILIEKLNRSAEDAAKRAKPIFVNAIRNMSFQDAMGILMGEKNAATTFLKNATYDQLYREFQPEIVLSLNKFNALDYWSDAVDTYNKIPFVQKMNPSLDDYVTTEALDGLFKMVEKEEMAIRANPVKRVTDLLRRVFALQDE